MHPLNQYYRHGDSLALLKNSTAQNFEITRNKVSLFHQIVIVKT